MTDPSHGTAPPAVPATPTTPAPPTARNVPALLLALRRTEFTGSVTVSSAPGGTIHLEQGLVAAIETPGAPTAATLLLKSRRVGEEEWASAETAASIGRPTDAPPTWGGDLGAALVAQGSIGAAELEAVCAAAAFDGAFALVLSPPGSWETAEAAPPARIALRPGIEPERLFEETARRTALLTRLWGPPGELARLRIRPAAGAESGALRIPVRYREILAAATGRRTARDLGFALGRGVFAVLLDVVRMDARHLLHREPAHPGPLAPSVAPRTPTSEPPPADTGPLPRRVRSGRGAGAPGGPGGLPARSEGAAAASDGPPNAHRAEHTARTETTEQSEKSAP
ncbi:MULTISPECIES: hypothetical protein [Streptomycetaceae]|uniref:hypothetical protein n=1 Tax=Streptomycetaceae TaxID=2062 RepID=UPI00093E08D0|nr:hypothetical protein [Streptomyces sp. CB02056]